MKIKGIIHARIDVYIYISSHPPLLLMRSSIMCLCCVECAKKMLYRSRANSTTKKKKNLEFENYSCMCMSWTWLMHARALVVTCPYPGFGSCMHVHGSRAWVKLTRGTPWLLRVNNLVSLVSCVNFAKSQVHSPAVCQTRCRCCCMLLHVRVCQPWSELCGGRDYVVES